MTLVEPPDFLTGTSSLTSPSPSTSTPTPVSTTGSQGESHHTSQLFNYPTHESDDATINMQSASAQSCTCQPWLVPSKRLCRDVRRCRYVQNVIAIRKLREQQVRTIAMTCTPTQLRSVASLPSPLHASVVVVAHFRLTFPQFPATLTDGSGWSSHGDGDSTGSVLWPTSIFACQLIQSVLRRRGESLQSDQLSSSSSSVPSTSQCASSPPIPFFDTLPLTTLELGCGSGLLTHYLSVISHSAARHFASDQNVTTVAKLKELTRITIEPGEATEDDEEEECDRRVQSRPATDASLSNAQLSHLSQHFQSRLHNFTILPYGWSTPLLTHASLQPIRDAPPDIILGADLVYFSIAYPKLTTTIWELFENHLYAKCSSPLLSNHRLKSWMGRQSRRKPSASIDSAANVSSDSSHAQSGTSHLPLLFLSHKCRDAETEQDLYLALSTFAHIYAFKREFVHHIQAESRRHGSSVDSHTVYPPWPMDHLPLDCHDPSLEFYFIIPKLEPVETPQTSPSPSSSSSSSSSSSLSHPSHDDWNGILASARLGYEPSSQLSSQSDLPHWLMKHFPATAFQSWHMIHFKAQS